MATKTFKEICVEYAHQLGKGLPLTPAEMCNAVIMYLNTQITEMQGITTALQTAVTEAESSATEATNTANELSGKVDTLQTNVTEAEANATEAINKSNSALETVNSLPKVPTPTTTDNGKVIGVQSGAYALVEQSGGEAPNNMVTTDTAQAITGNKTFKGLTVFNNTVGISLPVGSPNCCLTITKENSANTLCLTEGAISCRDNSNNWYRLYYPAFASSIDVYLPTASGTLALTGEIDEAITNILNSENTWGKKNKFGRGVDVTGQINIHNSDTSIERDGTLIVSGSMVYLQNYKVNEYYYAATLNNAQYNVDENILGSVDYFIDGIYLTPLTSDKTNIDTERGYLLKFPDKGGTIALTSDIPTPVTKYFTRVIFTDSNTDAQYIFSCVTNDDLSGNSVYGDVVSLLTELGAINTTSALPCSGKTAAGGVVICVYTDGSAITVFSGDNVTEEIPTSAEINVISR